MTNLILILILFLLGFALKKHKAFPENTPYVLNMLVVYVSLPALILVQIKKIEYSSNYVIPILFSWIAMVLSALLVWLVCKLLKFPKDVTGCLLLLVPLGNTSFFGVPMVNAFFGADAIPYAIFYDQFGTFLALGTYGGFILSLYTSNTSITFKNIIAKILKFPPFIAVLIGLGLKQISLPVNIDPILNPVAGTLVPLAILAVGFQLKVNRPQLVLKPFFLGPSLKLLVTPLIMFGIIQALALKTIAAKVSVFESGMPPMITAGALVIAAGLCPELAAGLIGFGLIFSFGSLSMINWLLATF